MNDEVKVIGLTGPTGSGKTVVAEVFKENGYEIIDADILAREATEDENILSKIRKEFGDDVVLNGVLDRKELAKRAFVSFEKEKILNSIIHPYVLSEAKELIEGYVFNEQTKIVFDAPLLFESNADEFCTDVVSVIAPLEKRIERIMARDNITKEEAEKRVSVQQSDDYYTDKSEYVIYNDKTLEDLKKKAQEIINEV